jgi:hypothetical protein
VRVKIMNTRQKELVEQYAIGAVFSDTAEVGYKTLTEKLSEGVIPDEVVVWQPYEDLDASSLLERVEEQHDIFKYFAESVLADS